MVRAAGHAWAAAALLLCLPPPAAATKFVMTPNTAGRLSAPAAPAVAASIYVSATSGSDSEGRDGTSPDSALRTLAAALPLVRRLEGPRALLLDGVFRLAAPLL